jgi:hypothetical protein
MPSPRGGSTGKASGHTRHGDAGPARRRRPARLPTERERCVPCPVRVRRELPLGYLSKRTCPKGQCPSTKRPWTMPHAAGRRSRQRGTLSSHQATSCTVVSDPVRARAPARWALTVRAVMPRQWAATLAPPARGPRRPGPPRWRSDGQLGTSAAHMAADSTPACSGAQRASCVGWGGRGGSWARRRANECSRSITCTRSALVACPAMRLGAGRCGVPTRRSGVAYGA